MRPTMHTSLYGDGYGAAGRPTYALNWRTVTSGDRGAADRLQSTVALCESSTHVYHCHQLPGRGCGQCVGMAPISRCLNVVFVSRQLGHANPNVILEVYAHLFERASHAAAARDALESSYAKIAAVAVRMADRKR
jgi:hypothetical protein